MNQLMLTKFQMRTKYKWRKVCMRNNFIANNTRKNDQFGECTSWTTTVYGFVQLSVAFQSFFSSLSLLFFIIVFSLLDFSSFFSAHSVKCNILYYSPQNV